MAISANTIKKHMAIVKPLLVNCSLKTLRRGQNKIGAFMSSKCREHIVVKEQKLDGFSGSWALPKDERRAGVILYLHGGGYTMGELDYTKGFASVLAMTCGARVFAPAYRLAPEHPYPAALDDALAAYKYLLDLGYPPSRITLCGESAGGGLCYALCYKLRELALDMPCGIIALSPWTDLTASGPSYEENSDADPSITKELLDYFARNYTNNRQNPFVSPLFGDVKDLPPSLIFAGGDEIMLSDSMQMHEKLSENGVKSRLFVAPERWHAYVLYNLRENEDDYVVINQFLDKNMAEENKLRWMRLDNAAKIYPAAMRPSWSNVFRLSATLTENVDKDILKSALDVTVRRFPSIASRLRRGVFWYYLEQISSAPEIMDENSYPLERMSRSEMRKCAFRVICYKKRIAVEFFHSLTDGTGGMIFLKTLVAEYLQQKYGVHIPAECGVLDRLEEPHDDELEDSFLKNSGNLCASRQESDAWHYHGTRERAGFLHLTCFKISVKGMLDMAHEYKVSLTEFLCAVMMMALQRLQAKEVLKVKKRAAIKVLLPVNLRRIFKSNTVRNFALYTTPEIKPALGEYSFEEICKVIHHHMGLDVNAKQMSMKIAKNVGDERSIIIKIIPLFLKNVVMRMVFDAVGEKKSCLSLSNLGAVKLPEEMQKYVSRMDFILGAQATRPHNCGVLSYGDTLYINFIRNTKESSLESEFFAVLRDMGISAEVESNLQY